MSKKTNEPQQVSTTLNQDEINKAGMAPPLPTASDKPIKPFSLAYWLSVANKPVALKWSRGGSAKGKNIATLG
jgi:hypothetical protein